MLNLTKLETVEIPLNKLTLWDDNVRTSGAEEGLDELIASICSVGLLQSLVVKKASRGTFIIGAGKRRFLALSQMAEQRRRQTLLRRPLPHRPRRRRPHRNLSR